MPKGSKKSYTEMEFDYAKSINKPILAFIHPDISQLIAAKVEKTQTGMQKLMAFAKKVKKNRNVMFWRNKTELISGIKTSIASAVTTTPTSGWIRGDVVGISPNAKHQIDSINNVVTEWGLERVFKTRAEKNAESDVLLEKHNIAHLDGIAFGLRSFRNTREKDVLQCLCNGKRTDMEESVNKQPKIFISHSSKDKDYVTRIVSLLDDMGLQPGQIFCSSLPGYDIPIDINIFDYLRAQFREFNLHVMIIHSDNYYQSAVSLNEMGAAWVLRSNCTSFLLPGFRFDQMTGVVNSGTIAIKLDNDETEVMDKLNQFYSTIANEFSVAKKPDIIWEQKRNSFITGIKSVSTEQEIARESVKSDTAQVPDNDIEILESGVYIRPSEKASGKNIYYCPACYTKEGKLYPIVSGSMARDKFCSNCKMHYTKF